MTVRDSITRTRARTPGAEDDPPSTTVRDRALGPTPWGISDVATKVHEGRTQTKYLPVYAGSSLKLANVWEGTVAAVSGKTRRVASIIAKLAPMETRRKTAA